MFEVYNHRGNASEPYRPSPFGKCSSTKSMALKHSCTALALQIIYNQNGTIPCCKVAEVSVVASAKPLQQQNPAPTFELSTAMMIVLAAISLIVVSVSFESVPGQKNGMKGSCLEYSKAKCIHVPIMTHTADGDSREKICF